MSATSAPYGFVPVNHPSGESRAMPYTIATGYGTAIYKGMPVILNTSGVLIAGTAAADILGMFMGVEYTDATGKRVVSNNWPASTTATNIVAWVNDNPNTVYSVQADGSIAATEVGAQADVSNVGNASTTTGLSQATLSASTVSAGTQAQFRIVGIDGAVDNAAGDAYTRVLVQIARHQYIANKVSL